MTKDKTLDEILEKLVQDVDRAYYQAAQFNNLKFDTRKYFAEAKAQIIALVPKKSLIWKDRFGKPTDIFVLGENYYRDACSDSWNDAIDATLEAFGGT